MKQEFEMQQSEMDDIIAINKNQSPVMKFGDYWSGMDLQEKINHYWETLGKKYGFKHLTVEGKTTGSHRIEVPKTQSEIEIEKYIGDAKGYLNYNVCQSLKRIVEQLEKCNYETEAGYLKNNVAFIALKEMASK